MLGEPDALQSRLSQLSEAHVAPLTDLVHRLRARVGSGVVIPYFDPWDGGVDAEVLFLLEAPGPKARDSGFVSRNNPDETARNFFEISQEAGIDRKLSVTWNIIPWYIGTATRIRAANQWDVADGLEPADELIRLLPSLRVIVLLGRKAQRAHGHLARSWPDLLFLACPHPSPMFVNRAPQNKSKILSTFLEIQALLDQDVPLERLSEARPASWPTDTIGTSSVERSGRPVMPKPVAVLMHVADVPAALAWYRAAFPAAVPRPITESNLGILDLNGFSIEIVRSDSKVGAGKSGTVIYWAVDDLNATIARLEGIGATLYRGPMPVESGASMCQVADPFGNLIGLRGAAPS